MSDADDEPIQTYRLDRARVCMTKDDKGVWVEHTDHERIVADLCSEVRKWQRAEAAVGEKVIEVCEENARLKAEVERFKFTLEEERQITRQDWAGLRCEHDRVKRALEQAEAEVERLRKAGDAMERSLSFAYPDSPKIKDWNAAKEGKQS